MVLCEEILQWLTDCENYPSAMQASSRRVAHSISLLRPESAVGDLQAATLHVAPVPANSFSANNAHGHTKSSREWTMLEQLSRELGKNLGDDGSRSSPLSPSDLAGAALQRVQCQWFVLILIRARFCQHLSACSVPTAQYWEATQGQLQ